jgi:DNA-binding transcriptional LysR family regulator
VVDKTLARQGVQRKIGAHLHSSLACGYAVARTDFVATVSSRLAAYFASLLPVRIVPLPFDVPPIRVSMVWHERSHRLGLHKWVRQVVKAVVQGKEAQEERGARYARPRR